MVIDSNNNIVYMSTDEAETYETVPTKELDPDLGLEVVVKQTIFDKYGVHCDPTTNSFYASLHRQFEKNGRLSERQVNALRK